MTEALYWLVLSAIATTVFAVPYVVERIGRVGFIPALGYSNYGTGGFDQPEEQPATWAKRAHAAHRNALEGLPVLAALVLTSHVTGDSGCACCRCRKDLLLRPPCSLPLLSFWHPRAQNIGVLCGTWMFVGYGVCLTRTDLSCVFKVSRHSG